MLLAHCTYHRRSSASSPLEDGLNIQVTPEGSTSYRFFLANSWSMHDQRPLHSSYPFRAGRTLADFPGVTPLKHGLILYCTVHISNRYVLATTGEKVYVPVHGSSTSTLSLDQQPDHLSPLGQLPFEVIQFTQAPETYFLFPLWRRAHISLPE